MAQLNNTMTGWWEAINNNNDNNTTLVVSVLALILAILWYKFKHSTSSNGEPPLPPGPRNLPIVGFLPFLTPDIHTQFTTMSQTFGPIFKFWLGSKLQVVINTPELVKEVVRDQDEAFSDRDQSIAALILTYGGQDIVFANNNANWRRLRRIFVHEIQSSKNLEVSSSFRRDEVRKTIKNVFTRSGTKVDIREIAFATETNVLTRMLWENTSDKEKKYSKLVADVGTVAGNIVEVISRVNLSDYFPSLARFDLQGIARDMKKELDKLDVLFTSSIEDRFESTSKNSRGGVWHESPTKKKDFLQILLDHTDQKDGSSLEVTQIKALLLDVLVAGSESPASLIEWVMAILIKNPDIMKRVQNELEQVVGTNNIVEESHITKLKYLDATVKETFRLYPVVPFLIPRSPSKDCTVGGYTIPKGSTIFLNVWSIHRDPRYWDNPLEFNPDRFLTNKCDYNGNNLKFFPFGAGRRICAGVPLAEKMVMLILASLLHSFDWRLPEGAVHDLNEFVGLSLKKKNSLVAIPTQRLSDVNLYM